MRAQIFETLTGGDPTVDCEDENPWPAAGSEGSDPMVAFVPLPQQILDELKVDLSVPYQSEGRKWLVAHWLVAHRDRRVGDGGGQCDLAARWALRLLRLRLLPQHFNLAAAVKMRERAL
jgi:hypothetical protein